MKQQIIQFLDLPFVKIILACPTAATKMQKCTLRPVLLKGKLFYQSETFQNNQAFHKNLTPKEAVSYLETLLTIHFKEIYILFEREDWQGRIKNGRLSFKKKGVFGKPSPPYDT